MRLLHTSDWHLGQTLHNHDRAWEHRRFLDWLLDTLVGRDIDALLVSGDIFDNANPSAATLRMLYRFLMDARGRIPHLNIVLIAGNHDSPGRLEAPAPFLEEFEAHVVGLVERGAEGDVDLSRLVAPLRDRAGATAAWCLAVPFLRPSDVPKVEVERGDAYLAGIVALYRQAQEHARGLLGPDQALVALGHCHMAGGQVSEQSERRILVGGAEMLPSDLFGADVAYAALGHLHRPQAVGGKEHIRYSGSPLPLSFAEIGYPHQVVVVELEGARLKAVEAVRVPRPVSLLRVPLAHAPLEEVEEALAALDLETVGEEAWPYLEVRVRLTRPEPGLRTRIEAALEGKPVRLARIDTTTAATGELRDGAEPSSQSLDDLSRLDPLAIFSGIYYGRYGEIPPDELIAALTEIVNAPEEADP